MPFWFQEKTRKSTTIQYKWENCIEGFNMPVKVRIGDEDVWLEPTTTYQSIKVKAPVNGKLVDRNFYVTESRTGS